MGTCTNATAHKENGITYPQDLEHIVKMLVTQSCPTLCNPMDYSLPGMEFSVHRILQARILEWIAIPFSRGSSQPRDQIQVFYIVGGFFTV